MLIVMDAHATPAQVQAVCDFIGELGYTPHAMPGANRTAIGVTGNRGPLEPRVFADLPGVARAIPVTRPYKLVLREMRDADTVVEVPRPGGDAVRVGDTQVILIAGPCAVETRDSLLAAARAVKDAGASMLRGGAYKPRTSPYSFQGLGAEGLRYLAEVRGATGLPVVTEAVDVAGVDAVEAHADVIQIGARNMQNFSLLRRVGRGRTPVLLKRGMSATIEELLQAAEYILAEGNYDVILCERGVRTFADQTRNTLDLSAVPVLKRMTHLPVIVDPSHATGSRTEVGPMARAAVAAGADGLMIEVHPSPQTARSDGAQSLRPEEFTALVSELRRGAEAVGRTV
jgi:3-deoxy-7-phosphoheptulonate synthase